MSQQDTVDSTEKQEIIDAEPDYTEEQDEVIRMFYTHLANLIPENGKDYKVSFSFNGKGTQCTVKIEAFTHIGKVFAQELENYFNNEEN